MKKFLSGLIFGLVISVTFTVIASELVVKPNQFPITVNGKSENVSAYNINGSTFIGLRDVAKVTDGAVDVNFEGGEIKINSKETEVVKSIDDVSKLFPDDPIYEQRKREKELEREEEKRREEAKKDKSQEKYPNNFPGFYYEAKKLSDTQGELILTFPKDYPDYGLLSILVYSGTKIDDAPIIGTTSFEDKDVKIMHYNIEFTPSVPLTTIKYGKTTSEYLMAILEFK